MTHETQDGFDLLFSLKMLATIDDYLGTWLLLVINKTVSAIASNHIKCHS
jgi:hypothetical protein